MLVTVGKVGGREGVGAERQDAEIDQEAALCARTSMYVCVWGRIRQPVTARRGPVPMMKACTHRCGTLADLSCRPDLETSSPAAFEWAR